MKTRTNISRAAIVVLLLTAACNSPTPTGSAKGATIDWKKPVVDLGGGWSLAEEPGDGPFIAVDRDGERVGTIELLRYEVSTLETIRKKLADGATVEEALRAHIAEFYDTFEKDRATGCGEDYVVKGDEPAFLDTKDGQVVRYGFTGTKGDGSPSEKVVHFAGLRKDFLVLVAVNASDPDGCMPAEGIELTEGSLTEFAPVLEAAIKKSGLPDPTIEPLA
jgi:hypothetical protein